MEAENKAQKEWLRTLLESEEALEEAIRDALEEEADLNRPLSWHESRERDLNEFFEVYKNATGKSPNIPLLLSTDLEDICLMVLRRVDDLLSEKDRNAYLKACKKAIGIIRTKCTAKD